MKAKLTFSSSPPQNAKQPENKEMVCCYNVVVAAKARLINAVTARLYMGRSKNASVVYACLWIRSQDYYCSGKGQAGGGGYDKRSAAVAEAINSAGVTLFDDNDNDNRVYEGNIEESLEAIVRALGYKGKLLLIYNQ